MQTKIIITGIKIFFFIIKFLLFLYEFVFFGGILRINKNNPLPQRKISLSQSITGCGKNFNILPQNSIFSHAIFHIWEIVWETMENPGVMFYNDIQEGRGSYGRVQKRYSKNVKSTR
nr:MAG TPA: hypothetical protein [Caudoviricetes sp.]